MRSKSFLYYFWNALQLHFLFFIPLFYNNFFSVYNIQSFFRLVEFSPADVINHVFQTVPICFDAFYTGICSFLYIPEIPPHICSPICIHSLLRHEQSGILIVCVVKAVFICAWRSCIQRVDISQIFAISECPYSDTCHRVWDDYRCKALAILVFISYLLSDICSYNDRKVARR